MKANEPLIPLAGVRLVPHSLIRAMLWVGIGIAAIAMAMLLHGLIAGELVRTGKQALIGFGIAIYVCGSAMLATRSDRRPRATAPLLWKHLQPRPPLPIGRFVVMFLLVVAVLGLTSGWELALRVGVPSAGILAGALAYATLYQRQMHRQATVLFALYADGVLDAAATAAIDDARQKDPAFDTAVREHQRVCSLVAAQLRG
jgi:hypothetical protein